MRFVAGNSNNRRGFGIHRHVEGSGRRVGIARRIGELVHSNTDLAVGGDVCIRGESGRVVRAGTLEVAQGAARYRDIGFREIGRCFGEVEGQRGGLADLEDGLIAGNLYGRSGTVHPQCGRAGGYAPVARYVGRGGDRRITAVRQAGVVRTPCACLVGDDSEYRFTINRDIDPAACLGAAAQGAGAVVGKRVGGRHAGVGVDVQQQRGGGGRFIDGDGAGIAARRTVAEGIDLTDLHIAGGIAAGTEAETCALAGGPVGAAIGAVLPEGALLQAADADRAVAGDAVAVEDAGIPCQGQGGLRDTQIDFDRAGGAGLLTFGCNVGLHLVGNAVHQASACHGATPSAGRPGHSPQGDIADGDIRLAGGCELASCQGVCSEIAQ